MRNLLETQIQKESSVKYEKKFRNKTERDSEDKMQTLTQRGSLIKKSSSKLYLQENIRVNSVQETENYDKVSENHHFFQTHEIATKDHKNPQVDRIFKNELDNIVKIAEKCNNNSLYLN